jgi:hypothetical protein
LARPRQRARDGVFIRIESFDFATNHARWKKWVRIRKGVDGAAEKLRSLFTGLARYYQRL